MEPEEEPGKGHGLPVGEEPEALAERRWALRRGVDLAADVSDASGASFAARITEISEGGCRIRIASAPALSRDLPHEIKVTGLEPLGAYVVWASKDDVGLAFSTPLDPLTVRSLVTKSLYARLSRRMAGSGRGPDDLPPLPPFPFAD